MQQAGLFQRSQATLSNEPEPLQTVDSDRQFCGNPGFSDASENGKKIIYDRAISDQKTRFSLFGIICSFYRLVFKKKKVTTAM